jgi:hypothetical protein
VVVDLLPGGETEKDTIISGRWYEEVQSTLISEQTLKSPIRVGREAICLLFSPWLLRLAFYTQLNTSRSIRTSETSKGSMQLRFERL